MLHTMSSGSFFRIPTDDARVILDRILEAEMDNTVAEPPKCLGPPSPVIVLRTSDGDVGDPYTLEAR